MSQQISFPIGTCVQCFQDKPLLIEVCRDCFIKTTGREPPMSEAGVPQFATYEDMQKYLKDHGKSSLTSDKSKSKKGKKPAQPDPSKKLETIAEVANNLIWKTVHVYTRTKDNWTNTLSDAKDDLKMFNNNVLIFAHDHEHGQDCTSICKQVK